MGGIALPYRFNAIPALRGTDWEPPSYHVRKTELNKNSPKEK
jgi:hypothetical protein